MRARACTGRERVVIRWIIWDIANTILHYHYELVFQRLARLTGKEIPRIRHLIGGDYFTPGSLIYDADAGRIGRKKFIRLLRKRLGIDSRIPNKRLAWCFMDCFELPNATRTLLHFLADHYRMGIISNMNPVQWPHIRETFPTLHEDSGVFAFHVLSCRDKLVKPDLRIYALAFGKACAQSEGALLPGECVFIDDREENVKAAEEFGMRAILADESGPWGIARNLADLGVLLPPADYYPPPVVPRVPSPIRGMA
ncbi:MAG: hypothetical protein UZ00_C0004G0005 [Parcubacteria group bacterium GW2011_GWA1_60_11]|nr:MAG: hypothetical protein UZ00_C0004G0005 [Parcubacteria group bacterium GW2011_GWA1_60_11]